jgi:hypothetical protein
VDPPLLGEPRGLERGQVAVRTRAVSGLRRVGELRTAACPRPGIFAVASLCLSCGRVVATYSKPARGLVEAPVDGREWAPPCPAVQRLRDCLHRPYSLLRADGWRVSVWDDLGDAA